MKFRAHDNIAIRRRGKISLLILSSPQHCDGGTFGLFFSIQTMPNEFFQLIPSADRFV
jgi:hypothetical protein